ncbi:enoyl-CoA hydratase/isomerase family protein [Undibacterium cyanobacteriorum]|uniref:Enoyl-CoA hydratase/isomerase family protein n=1 Tax=Undibacterium cyanobacteriorum TaxID=3073561 RepID=A0ABY9RLV8_9BURK|nr:enoyl-CoA hydratase/isomerase family protein [Undibacterium sp. 20NA77.5]WMW81250.1 enoyl-CoA hydratase/isomerase family protein [Undibacterium sp. 20NA77.5]
MENFVLTEVKNEIGFITLDRPKALNSLSLTMVRELTATLRAWHNDPAVRAVFIHSSSEKAFCAGGDIRFFYDVGTKTPMQDSALLEDFFTEEYALNHLIHFYPKPYIALMNGVVMGGGMGIAQSGVASRLRIVTEKTKMAMPEVNIGLFPDVGGGYFLNRTPGQIGAYLGLTGEIIGAADALYANLADVYVPTGAIADLMDLLSSTTEADIRTAIRDFARAFADDINVEHCNLAQQRSSIDHHFQGNQLAAIYASLSNDESGFAKHTLTTMDKRSPLLMAVTLEQLRRCQRKSVAECLRMERTMVRHCFKHGEVLEGVRALVVDKDNAPKWSPSSVAEVNEELVHSFFAPVWPDYAHPLAHLP